MPIENVKELREKQKVCLFIRVSVNIIPYKVTKLMLGTTLYEMEMKPFNTSSTVNNEVSLQLCYIIISYLFVIFNNWFDFFK